MYLLVFGAVCVMYASDVDGDMEECDDGDVDVGDDVEEGDGDGDMDVG